MEVNVGIVYVECNRRGVALSIMRMRGTDISDVLATSKSKADAGRFDQ